MITTGQHSSSNPDISERTKRKHIPGVVWIIEVVYSHTTSRRSWGLLIFYSLFKAMKFLIQISNSECN